MEWHARGPLLTSLYRDASSRIHSLPRDIVNYILPYLETDVTIIGCYTKQPTRRGIPHGTYVVRFSDGILKHQCVYVDGKREGLDTKWYQDGGVCETYMYQNNMRNGQYNAYYVDGRPMFKGVYKNDDAHGVHTHYYYTPDTECNETLYLCGVDIDA